MKSDLTIHKARTVAKKTASSRRSTAQQVGNDLWTFVNAVSNGVKEYITQPLGNFARTVLAWSEAHRWYLPLQLHVALNIATWVINDVERRIDSWIVYYVDRLKAWTFRQVREVYYILGLALTTLRADLTMKLRAEVKARIKAVAHAEAQAKKEVTALHHAIEREAATAYQSGNAGHLDAVAMLGDTISALEPTLNKVVGKVIQYAIDLAEVDNPLIRFLASKLIRYLIVKLGVDKIAGQMLDSLVNPVRHMGAPKGLADAITMICGRINSLEQFNATFMADGGPEILRAGEQWRDETSIRSGVELLAFFGTMVAEPNAWATVVADTIGTAIYGTIDAVSALLKE